MTSIIENIKARGENISPLEGHDRLQYLVDLARDVPPLSNKDKTDENHNTVLSSPLSFLSAKQSQNVALIEMGTNQPGEIKSICEVFQPNIGLITNISNAHIENFYSINDILHHP